MAITRSSTAHARTMASLLVKRWLLLLQRQAPPARNGGNALSGLECDIVCRLWSWTWSDPAREVSNDPMVKRAVGFNTGYEIASTGLMGGMIKATAPDHKKNHPDHPKFEDYLNSNDVISIGARRNKKGKSTYYKTRSFNKHKASYYK